MKEIADVVIVGGGVMGTSIALALARRGAGRVLLLERAFLGAGSSGKSGAIIRQHYSHRLTTSMARWGLHVFRDFADVVGGPAVFTHTGMVVVVGSASRPALEANLAMQRALGVDVRLVSRDELADIDPALTLAGDETAAFESEAGYVEAMQVVASFAQAARRHGAEIREGVEVTRLLIDGDRAAGVETTAGPIASRRLVLAAGPWAARVAATAGVSLPVNPCRTQVAWYRKPAASHPTGPQPARPLTKGGLQAAAAAQTPKPASTVLADFTNAFYAKPTYGDMLHVGTISPREAEDVVDPDCYPEGPNDAFVREHREKLCRRLPIMRRGPNRGGYSALYSITPDWHPILDRLPGVEGAYCAVGFSGHGFKLSPAVGQVMAELVLDGAATTFDVRSLRASRFAEGELVTSPYEYGVIG